MRRFSWRSLSVLVLVAAVAAGCSAKAATNGSSSSGSGPAKLTLVAYSTPQEAYAKIISSFTKTPQGKGITFSQSFGASGQQSRAVLAGLDADIVAFSLAPDMTKLVKKGIVAPTWNAGPTKGMVTDSVVVIGVRKGNPKHIRSWDDLLKPGVQVLTPNPFTSGGARWNVMAAYGAASNKGADEAKGVAYLKALFKNVVVQDASGRQSVQTFLGGKGDAIISYENEAIGAQQKGAAIDYIVPDQTIRIENPVAVTTKSKHPAQAKAFLDYLHSAPAQQIFGQLGYRPTDAAVLAQFHNFPTPSGLFTIADLGGWTDVSTKFFDPSKGIMAGVERSLGVSVGS